MGEHTQPLRDRPASASSRAFWPRLLILALAIPPLLVLFDLARPTRRANECALCRLQKVDSRFLWFRRSETHPNKCSRWYQAHVEPTHTHLWAPCAHCERIGIPGIYGGYACSVGSRITGLSQTVQIDIYRHFKNPLEAKRFFVRSSNSTAQAKIFTCGIRCRIGSTQTIRAPGTAGGRRIETSSRVETSPPLDRSGGQQSLDFPPPAFECSQRCWVCGSGRQSFEKKAAIRKTPTPAAETAPALCAR